MAKGDEENGMGWHSRNNKRVQGQNGNGNGRKSWSLRPSLSPHIVSGFWWECGFGGPNATAVLFCGRRIAVLTRNEASSFMVQVFGVICRIYRGIYKQRDVAIKLISQPEEDESLANLLEKQFTSEVALLFRLRHPNIITFVAACKKPPVFCIITEYLAGGSLRKFLHQQEPHFSSIRPGTYRWMAPEMIKEKHHTKKVDVYSFGIVLWELLTALIPFDNMTPEQVAFAVSQRQRYLFFLANGRPYSGIDVLKLFMLSAVQNARPPLDPACPMAFRHLISRCWSSSGRQASPF
ncbi:Serine/threonine-protein kinase HT1 [Vitis vinifera]|uniref:Serine/threonine-protein kinase HT1 n=1 Tax=Vitis vinifera TaxID=29760 RepID=A0A438EYR0_VITVI|nr:Serine/threonine-protein kinase HT1 [Vitis vinifera]